MKIFNISIKKHVLFIMLLTLLTGCDDWIDVDTDPNSIVDGPLITEDIMLIGIEAEWAVLATERFETWNGFPQWLSWHAIEGSVPPNFTIVPSYGNAVWNSYSASLKHAVELYEKAKENGNTHYQGVAGIIAAFHWFYIADVYDQAPLEEAMQGLDALQPSLASQATLYARANGLLDEAITLLSAPNQGDLVPDTDDYLLNGDMDKWIRYAYSLKARQALRLSYDPSTSKTTQADLVLSFLQNGMTSNDDNVMWKHLEELTNANPLWGYMTRAYSGGLGLTPGNFLIDLMNSYNDPRRPIMFTFSEEFPDGFVGLRAGEVVQPGKTPSHWRFTYLSMSYPAQIMMYAETEFIKAEAYAFKGQWALAEEAMKAGIRADMEFVGVDPVDIDSYLAQASLTMPTNEEDAQRLIMEQKYMANLYRTNETYFDWIRTGYPLFDFEYMLNNVGNAETFPRRFPYPLNEVERNPNITGQPNWLVKGTTWDNK
ncbi:SusD/RagB family nutrient-binding outer membrane lipoprotein [Arenibacter palladensis]|nr:SusD/RagB family nutrient-binding outer membrane lipoprotein [Arenibacter palladensis]